MYCEDCFCEIPEAKWMKVPAAGTIKLHTVVAIDSYGEKLEEPRVIRMINIDNTDGTLIGLIKIDNIDEDLRGKQVKAVFRPISEREWYSKRYSLIYKKVRW